MKARIQTFTGSVGAAPRISLPEAGRFSVGIFEDQQNRPRGIDYFRPYQSRGQSPEEFAVVEKVFREIYGPEPREIKVSFLDSNP